MSEIRLHLDEDGEAHALIQASKLLNLFSIKQTIICLMLLAAIHCRAAEINLIVDAAHSGSEINLTRYALGQGGLSEKPMFDSHVEQIAQLHPQTIRIFVQEFFNLQPERGRYHWDTLDKVIETILATKARPILCLCFKPKILFPKIDQRIVHPNDYKQWEELIYHLVKHCNEEKRYGIEYWEVSNEPDIGEDGGCPYLFQPEDYVTYYTHTANAILRADAKAKVGGPALAGYNSDIGRALIEHCGKGETPLHFFSWHIYHSDPEYFRRSIREVKTKLAKFPKLEKTETVIDEWNMSLDEPVLDPAFQPAFVLETTRVFDEEGLSRGAYYHIRDSFVDERQFATFMSKPGAAFVARWWNDTPQYDGLYDNQGRVRPAYHAFKLLSLLKGNRLPVSGTNAEVKALAARNGNDIHAVIWSFPTRPKPDESVEVHVSFVGIKSGRFRLSRLDAKTALSQFELESVGDFPRAESKNIQFTLRPYEIRWIAISP